jgi:hypothetical protein
VRQPRSLLLHHSSGMTSVAHLPRCALLALPQRHLSKPLQH